VLFGLLLLLFDGDDESSEYRLGLLEEYDPPPKDIEIKE